MEFITNLPESQGYKSIFFMVDWHTKMALFVPICKSINAKEVAKILSKEVISRFWSPEEVILDYRPQFTFRFGTEQLN